MEISELLSEGFDRIKTEIINQLEKYEESVFIAEIRDLVNCVDRSMTRFSKPGWSLGQLEMDEGEYLLHSAIWFWVGNDYLKHSHFDGALNCLMKSQSNIGAMNALLALRKSNAHKANKENKELKHQAITYWRENIDMNLSNDKAAEILIKQVPLTARVLSRYISEEKKRIQQDEEMRTHLRERFLPTVEKLLTSISKSKLPPASR